jgi:DNA-binding transcriptional MerR regulator/methylmalonyl-CoA mutase cobalamin-binding subunit
MALSKTPIYNLKVVLKETGLKPDVLRAWERRYGIPTPERSQGGHRLYSEFDIALLKWLVVRQNEGMSISRAVEMFREQSAHGKNLLEEKLPQTIVSGRVLQQAIYYPPETTLEAIRSHWLAACLNYNEVAAEQALNQAFGMYPVEAVCMEVLQRGISEMGLLWYEGRASVQQEHFASALAMRRLDALLSASPAPTRPYTILVGCPPGEWHAFTALMIDLLLRRRGLNVVYLGANVPVDRFMEAVSAANARLVILAAQQLTTAAALQLAAGMLSRQGVSIAFGGRIFSLYPQLVCQIEGYFLGERLESVIENVETLLQTQPPFVAAPSPVTDLLETLQAFQAKRAQIEAALYRHFASGPADVATYLEAAIRFTGDNISASLQLGSLEYMTEEINWLTQLFKSHHKPVDAITNYLTAYAMIVREQLAEHAGPLDSWFAAQLRLP